MRTFSFVDAISMTASAVLLVALLASSPVQAHVVLVNPMPRTSDTNLRADPCGGKPAGASVATYTAGTNIEITIDLVVQHSRSLHAVISYDNFATRTGLAMIQTSGSGIYTMTVPIPMQPVGSAVLQVTHGRYVSCADITLSEGALFAINAGHAGAWYDPETSGQGQLIDVVPEDQFMFLAWFTFTDAASSNPDEQHWYTAQGDYNGNSAELILSETLGGQFDDPQETSTNPVGTVTVSFSDCEQGQMVYSIDTDGREGTIPLERLIPGSGNTCEDQSGTAAAATEAVDINAGMDGAWFDTNTPGQGFFIDVHPDPEGGNFIFVSWFTYGDDTASGLRWLTAQGSFEGSIAEIDVFETTGGSFDDPQEPSTTQVGTMSLDFTDCNNAQIAYSLPVNGAEGDIAITRVVPGTQALCEELAGAN
jgi:hypothetical protein